ncbi:hypothetical protein [Rickettsia endosymbiont of Halotydeus destructor]|uniref:hypothetical protein n=1 Tax=Rickettsia endosymbiont of Halotydeus destructor TaxID=2996754 RepID=UPI003BB1F14D
MQENAEQNKKIIENFEQQVDKLIKEQKEQILTKAILGKFLDDIISNLKDKNLIDEITFDIYQGKAVIENINYPHNALSNDPEIHQWQKFYNFNRDIMLNNTLTFLSNSLITFSLKDKLYYSFAKLCKQLGLQLISDHFTKKLNNI